MIPELPVEVSICDRICLSAMMACQPCYIASCLHIRDLGQPSTVSSQQAEVVSTQSASSIFSFHFFFIATVFAIARERECVYFASYVAARLEASVRLRIKVIGLAPSFSLVQRPMSKCSKESGFLFSPIVILGEQSNQISFSCWISFWQKPNGIVRNHTQSRSLSVCMLALT